jgi:hypothetical protein
MDFFCIIEVLKHIAEAITAIATAIIIIITLVKKIPKLKYFFIKIRTNIRSFFIGTLLPNGRRVRFFRGLKEQRNVREAILKTISTDCQMEDVLVLDKNALFDIISKSGAFYTIRQRKS